MSEKQKFVIVYHRWFVYSHGFEEETIERETLAEAEEYAYASAHHMNSRACVHADAHVVQGPFETVKVAPRRLTWKERISGRIGV